MVSFLAFLVGLPTLYTLTAWAISGYHEVAVRPLDRRAALMAFAGAVAAAIGAPITYS